MKKILLSFTIIFFAFALLSLGGFVGFASGSALSINSSVTTSGGGYLSLTFATDFQSSDYFNDLAVVEKQNMFAKTAERFNLIQGELTSKFNLLADARQMQAEKENFATRLTKNDNSYQISLNIILKSEQAQKILLGHFESETELSRSVFYNCQTRNLNELYLHVENFCVDMGGKFAPLKNQLLFEGYSGAEIEKLFQLNLAFSYATNYTRLTSNAKLVEYNGGVFVHHFSGEQDKVVVMKRLRVEVCTTLILMIAFTFAAISCLIVTIKNRKNTYNAFARKDLLSPPSPLQVELKKVIDELFSGKGDEEEKDKKEE